ncbi:MAG: hypothetical protein WCA77_03470 [Thermoplasmata archaeon]
MPRRRASAPSPTGLAALRRSGSISEILFLYECTTEEPTQLKPIAERLGVTVQAVSHSFRLLARRGLVELREGRYLPTVAGVQWLHSAFGSLRDDLDARSERLHMIRSTRAVAFADVRAGDSVVLEMKDGVLGARPGIRGPSRGKAVTTANEGELLRVEELEGILPVLTGKVRVITIATDSSGDPETKHLLAERLQERPPGLVAAPGLEAFHVASRATSGPVLRFGVAAAVIEASRVGVDTTVVLLDTDLPRFLGGFSGRNVVPLTVDHLRGTPSRRHRPRARRVENP